jgi:arginyl-tRNA--protein-N-Asp/Glu arginylyltransferase
MAAQAQQMQGYLVRVESFLERVEAALNKLSLLPAMLKTSTMSGPLVEVGVASFTEDKVSEIYGCFSPHARDNSPALPSVLSTLEGEAIAAIVTPVLQIMPEL